MTYCLFESLDLPLPYLSTISCIFDVSSRYNRLANCKCIKKFANVYRHIWINICKKYRNISFVRFSCHCITYLYRYNVYWLNALTASSSVTYFTYLHIVTHWTFKPTTSQMTGLSIFFLKLFFYKKSICITMFFITPFLLCSFSSWINSELAFIPYISYNYLSYVQKLCLSPL